MRRTLSLTDALSIVDRSDWADDLDSAARQLEEMREAFPEETWAELPLESYALGQKNYRGTFCHLAEFRTPALGSISGGGAVPLSCQNGRGLTGNRSAEGNNGKR